MDVVNAKKKRSILRRFWRKISGRKPTEAVGQKISADWLPNESRRVELPEIVHASSFSSSVDSNAALDNRKTKLSNDRAWRRASMPITRLEMSEPFRSSTEQEDSPSSRLSACSSFKSNTTTIGNDTKHIDGTPPPVQQSSKLPRPHRRRTIDLGDTVTRTVTMTGGFYETSHDQGWVRVEIHTPESESPPISPGLASRIPLPSTQLKVMKSSFDMFSERAGVQQHQTYEDHSQAKEFVLESTPPISPFMTPGHKKSHDAARGYQLSLPPHNEEGEINVSPVLNVEVEKVELLPRRFMLAPGPPPPMSLPPTPMKNRLRLDFASPSKSPSRIPIATRRRYASQESPPRHVSLLVADGNRRRSNI